MPGFSYGPACVSYNETMRKSVSGFTIVELLIVIIVIAILSAITIVTYSGVQNRTYDASVQSDLRTIAKKMELVKIDSVTATYPTTNPTIDAAIPDLKVTKSAYAIMPNVSYNLLFCWPNLTTPNDYALLATSRSGKRFYIRASGEMAEYTGAVSWYGSDLAAVCGSVISGSSAAGAGYSAGDTTTGPWRAWTES